jgi:hypothetical protein
VGVAIDFVAGSVVVFCAAIVDDSTWPGWPTLPAFSHNANNSAFPLFSLIPVVQD